MGNWGNWQKWLCNCARWSLCIALLRDNIGIGCAVYDRHHGVKVAELGHGAAGSNHVALSPVDAGLAATVSDDMTLRIWRSADSAKKLGVANDTYEEQFALNKI